MSLGSHSLSFQHQDGEVDTTCSVNLARLQQSICEIEQRRCLFLW